jgi:hypothetical protein
LFAVQRPFFKKLKFNLIKQKVANSPGIMEYTHNSNTPEQEDCEYKASLSYQAIQCLKKAKEEIDSPICYQQFSEIVMTHKIPKLGKLCLVVFKPEELENYSFEPLVSFLYSARIKMRRNEQLSPYLCLWNYFLSSPV